MSRQSDRRDRFFAAGGSQISVLLAKAATVARRRIKGTTGETDEAMIGRLLVEESERLKK